VHEVRQPVCSPVQLGIGIAAIRIELHQSDPVRCQIGAFPQQIGSMHDCLGQFFIQDRLSGCHLMMTSIKDSVTKQSTLFEQYSKALFQGC